MQIGEGDSRQQTEEKYAELRKQETSLLDSICKDDGGLQAKFLLLAETIEDRIKLDDPMCLCSDISQISTYIRRYLASTDPPSPAANNVDHYLPSKYKDPNFSKWGKLGAITQTLQSSRIPYGQQLEKCSIGELESYLETQQKAKNDLDKAITQLNNDIEDVRREAVRRGIRELGKEKLRDAISARDYRFEIPEDADLEELNNEVVVQMKRVIHEYEVFVENFIEYPGYTKEDARKWGNSARTYANMMAIVNEKKWSGEIDFWLDRNYWKKVQSSHKSGNSTFFPTTLCGRCSKNIDEDPKDFHVTKYDKTSPTGYRCDNCGSFEILVRFTSREQVGDKAPEVDRMASDIVNHLEHYVDIFKDWRIRSLNPTIQSRKRAISNEFRIASMGKENIVVPRKKTHA